MPIDMLDEIQSQFQLDLDWLRDLHAVYYHSTQGMHLAHYHLTNQSNTVIILATSKSFRSGSNSFFILAISYTYWMGILVCRKCPGIGVNFYFPVAFFRNHEVSGGFIMNLKVLSVQAVSLTFKGTSCLTCVVNLLNSSQNFIMLIPRGPRDCPILGLGLAIPAYTLRLTVAQIKDRCTSVGHLNILIINNKPQIDINLIQKYILH